MHDKINIKKACGHNIFRFCKAFDKVPHKRLFEI